MVAEARLVVDRERLPSSSRYELLLRIASGGMATVYVGELRGAVGFRRLVAIKRAHPHLLENEAFREMFVAEARLASRLHHPNIVGVTDVEEADDELVLVMDYVDGVALSDLLEAGDALEPSVALRILIDACAGLQAAHELTDDDGGPMDLVHRDVSPHNILVGADGSTFLVDFGIAKAVHSKRLTETGALKGKLSYMAPEHLRAERATQRTDVFSMGVVAWETLTGRRLFARSTEVATLDALNDPNPPPRIASVHEDLDAIVARALAKDPERRFRSAAELRAALEAHGKREGHIATSSDVARVVREVAGEALEARRALLRRAMGKSKIEPTATDRTAVPEDADRVTRTLEVPSKSVAPRAELTASGTSVNSRAAAQRRSMAPIVVAAVVLAGGGVAATAILLAARPGRIEGASAPASLPPLPTVTGAGASATTAPPGPSAPIASAGRAAASQSASAVKPHPFRAPPTPAACAAPPAAVSRPREDRGWAPSCNPYTDPNCSKN